MFGSEWLLAKRIWTSSRYVPPVRDPEVVSLPRRHYRDSESNVRDAELVAARSRTWTTRLRQMPKTSSDRRKVLSSLPHLHDGLIAA